MPRRVGVREVARLAGVSTASVSRALNDPNAVGRETRLHVEAAVEQLGYIPNSAARALSRQRTNTIGAIVPTIDNAIFARGLEALQLRVGERGYNLVLAVSGYDPKVEHRQVHSLITSGVEALWLLGDAHLPQTYELMDRAAIPFVNTYTYEREARGPCVGFDNRAASARATRYLLDLGHRRVGMIAGIQKWNDRATGRAHGVRDALGEAGLMLPDRWFTERRYDIADGGQGLRAIMDARDRPTAVLCGNDVLAFGAILEARALGIRVPEDLSIVGFDDLELATHLRPSLTTIHVPTAEMSRLAADYLLGRLEGQDMPRTTEVTVNLVVRESTGRPPAN